VAHVAGFSLSEYTALVPSGALSFEDGVRFICSSNRHEQGTQAASEEASNPNKRTKYL